MGRPLVVTSPWALLLPQAEVLPGPWSSRQVPWVIDTTFDWGGLEGRVKYQDRALIQDSG